MCIVVEGQLVRGVGDKIISCSVAVSSGPVSPLAPDHGRMQRGGTMAYSHLGDFVAGTGFALPRMRAASLQACQVTQLA